MQTAVITTWLCGSHIKGTLSVMYVYAEKVGADLVCSPFKYSTPEGARKAAKKRGFDVLQRTAQGHNEARRRLGLPMISYDDQRRTLSLMAACG